ncbi:MAG: OmpP1/FadL family transporter [Myxococcaceae bacterium]
MKKLTLVVLFAASAAQAAGFALDTHGARATGMATAVTAQIDDASAVYYNVAGIAQGKRLEVLVGDTLIMPSLAVEGPTGTVTGSIAGPVPPPHLFITYGVTELISVGFGVFTPFGASSKWPAEWEGRERTLSSSLATYCFNPELALKLGDRFRVGAGVQLVRSTVVLSRGTNFVDSVGEVTLGGASWGTGLNVGAQFVLMKDTLDLGFAYRSDVNLDFDGQAHFTDVPVEMASRLQDQGVTTSVRLPETYAFGLAARPIAKLSVAFDVNYTAWSRFQELKLTFEDSALSSTLAKRWTDTVNFHLGGEYQVNDELQVRLGLVYDPTPTPEDTLTPDLPDSNRMKITAGAGYQVMKGLRADLGYQLVILTGSRSTSPYFPAEYSGTAQVVGLSVAYRM